MGECVLIPAWRVARWSVVEAIASFEWSTSLSKCKCSLSVNCNSSKPARTELEVERTARYQTFVNHTVQLSKSSESSTPGCEM